MSAARESVVLDALIDEACDVRASADVEVAPRRGRPVPSSPVVVARGPPRMFQRARGCARELTADRREAMAAMRQTAERVPADLGDQEPEAKDTATAGRGVG